MTPANPLQKVLANTFALYTKAHSFHWNVTGPHFHGLHHFFEELYTTLWNELDDIAEQMRIQGDYAPKNLAEMVVGAEIKDEKNIPSDTKMVDILEQDLKVLVVNLEDAAAAAAEEENKELEGFFIDLASGHKKTLWMMRSMKR